MGESDMAEIGRLIARAVTDPAQAVDVGVEVSQLVHRFPAYAESPVSV